MSGAPQVVVIGAGPNGLAGAAFLRQAGLSVVVCEARGHVGGLAASEEFHPGYATGGLLHDSAMLRPEVVEELQLTDFGLRLRNAPPVFTPQDDGRGLLLHDDPAAALAEIQAHEPVDAPAFGDYRAFLDRVRPVLARLFREPPPGLELDTLGGMWGLLGTGFAVRRLGRRDLTELARVAPMCVADWMRERFRSDLVQAAVASPALDASVTGPWSPGTAMALLLRSALGGQEVAGGPPALVAALERACGHLGADVRTNARVERIELDHSGVVRAVTLAGGESIECAAVVSAVDPRRTFLDLVDPLWCPPELAEGARLYRGRGATAKVHLALDGPLELDARPDLKVEALRTGTHLDDLERSFDPAKYRDSSTRPLLDVRVPTLGDGTLAPPGHHVVSVLAQFAPHDLAGGWTEEATAEFGERVIDELSRAAPTLRERLVATEVLAPPDLDARFGTVQGHVFHGELALDQLLMLRPFHLCGRYATPIPGLFLGGSGSHAGWALQCGAGRLAARAVAAALTAAKR